MTIRAWPTTERPREKLLEQGATILSDAELLAIILRTGSRGCSAVEMARRLLKDFGGIRSLVSATPAEACRAHGLGAAKFSMLLAAVELAKRHMQETVIREGAFTSPQTTKDYLLSHLRDRRREVFSCLFLDTKHRLIANEDLFQGTIDSASVYPRVIAERALVLNAAAVIAAHNHPSGETEPSQADIAVTKRIQDCLDLLDIRLLDHFIVGEGEPISMAERGLIKV